MNEKRLSIIVPVYNTVEYLAACIASIPLSKGMIEVIMVDDGSTDGSSELCDTLVARYQHVQDIQVIHQSNQGLSAARNSGIRAATGEYLLFLDSDDLLNTDNFHALLTHANETDVIFLQYQNFYGEHLTSREDTAVLPVQENTHYSRETIQALLTSAQHAHYYLFAPRMVVRRSLVNEHSLFFKEGMYHEDEEWCIRLLCEVTSVQFILDPLYWYRRNRINAITTIMTPKRYADLCAIVRYHEALYGSSLQQDQFIHSRIKNLLLSLVLYYSQMPSELRVVSLGILKSRISLFGTGSRDWLVKCCIRLGGVKLLSMLAYAKHCMGRR